MKTIKATEARKTIGELPRWELQLYLQENGSTSVYKASKDLGWTPGKTHAIVRTLEHAAVLESRLTCDNGRAQKIISLLT